ncbi:MAG TPA: VOC family protein [Dehalococcoidia bacterium]|nr:VOC family protein [Dehalococcoidia bacterium]
MITISELDHIVLNVADIDRSLHFYGDLLGMEKLRVEEFKAGKVPFPSLRVTGDTIIDLFPPNMADDARSEPATESRRDNLNHFCLVTDAPDLTSIRDELTAAGYPTQEPVERWGARGVALSIYLKDPDGNTLEIRTYNHQ